MIILSKLNEEVPDEGPFYRACQRKQANIHENRKRKRRIKNKKKNKTKKELSCTASQCDRDITRPAWGYIIIGQFHFVLLREREKEREQQTEQKTHLTSYSNHTCLIFLECALPTVYLFGLLYMYQIERFHSLNLHAGNKLFPQPPSHFFIQLSWQ